ncbi:MAG: hypothetical protein [Caudoviricetes sp.]|nr:MAG: hypothetical protein [Caudoviricetes sp.]
MNKGISRPKSEKTDAQKKQMKSAAEQLIKHLGGLTEASKFLDVKFYVLNGWRTRGQIPFYQAERISAIDSLNKAGFTFEYMRPDLEN